MVKLLKTPFPTIPSYKGHMDKTKGEGEGGGGR